ncbi:hypothetical protein [Mesorhizobium sp. WSM3626]|uniref:hypothetical protein n=1 Tax=Mesorhizobium sp. WSM3626 TaxID=1040987 RepID=UPI00047F78E1|nr:hypothetical protein [Mesorhizobium sp. WSM3626]
MTKLSDLGPPIEGKPHEGEPDAERFYLCKICGQAVDMCDLRQVMWHEQPSHEPLEQETAAKILVFPRRK